MSPAALAVIGFVVGIPAALFLTWAIAELTGDLDVQEWESGEVLSLEEWKERRR